MLWRIRGHGYGSPKEKISFSKICIRFFFFELYIETGNYLLATFCHTNQFLKVLVHLIPELVEKLRKCIFNPKMIRVLGISQHI